MKLSKSIPVAKYYLATPPLSESGRAKLARHMVDSHEAAIAKADYPNLAYAWAMWLHLTPEQRKHVILQSVPESDLVGDYFQSVKDYHVDALLRRVVTPMERARQVVWAKAELQ